MEGMGELVRMVSLGVMGLMDGMWYKWVRLLMDCWGWMEESEFFFCFFRMKKEMCIWYGCSGGCGMSGVNGGVGGYVYVMVNEEDFDIFIGVEWDVRGGYGGCVGEYGVGGVGGYGGDGGVGCIWFDF